MADHEADTATPFLSQQTYDVIKWLAQVLFPALGVLYAAVATILNLPYGVQVVGVIAAVDTFLAVILGISKSSFQAAGGDGQVNPDTGHVELSPDALNKDTIVITNPAKGVSQ